MKRRMRLLGGSCHFSSGYCSVTFWVKRWRQVIFMPTRTVQKPSQTSLKYVIIVGASCGQVLYASLLGEPRPRHPEDEGAEDDRGDDPPDVVVPGETVARLRDHQESADRHHEHHRDGQQHLPGHVHELVDAQPRQ